VQIDLLYGRKGLTVDLEEAVRAHLIRKHPLPLLPDPAGAVRRALEKPVAGPPLQELARGKRTACILICDITRPVPNGLILPPLVESLSRAGIARENMLILVATGLHRPNVGAELTEIVGSPEIRRTVRIENHLARDREAHVDLGRTSTGIPILIDRRFVEADLKIVTGLVEPHFMAGYSGGRKVVAPGVAYQDTILHFHRSRILEHCKAANCIIEGNPLHNEQTEIVRAIGGVVAVNVVIDEERRLGLVNFGEVEASHAEAVAFMRRYAEVRIPRRFKTIVTTAAGYPLDKTYYQTIKGMVGVMDVLEPGGTIIIASECSEGLGSPEFAEAQRLLGRIGPERFMTVLAGRDQALIDEWQTEMLLKPLRKGHIQLYAPGLAESDRKLVFVETIPSVEQAVAASIRAHGDAEIAVVPEGPYVIPLFGLPA
jgi:nickel-dependent lactate racemase